MNTRKRKIVLPGGSGFLGRTLAAWFAEQGDDVIVLSRRAGEMEHARVVQWDARAPGSWVSEFEHADAVINLTGRSVNCRYTAANRDLMMRSRTESTTVVGEAIARCDAPPKFWANSSTATIYRHRYDAPNDEETGQYGADPEAKDAYSVEVATAWEEAFDGAYRKHDLAGTRGVLLRMAMVIGSQSGGVFHVLRRLTRFGLGGRMGTGRQYVSWLHADDLCRAIEWLMANSGASGIYNLTAPNPVPNAEMMALFRRRFHMPIGLPATKWMLEIGAFFMRTETELILKSRRVVPRRLLDGGFEFRYSNLEDALQDLGG